MDGYVLRLCIHMKIGISYKIVTQNSDIQLYLKASRLAVFTITRFIVIGHCDSVTSVTFSYLAFLSSITELWICVQLQCGHRLFSNMTPASWRSKL